MKLILSTSLETAKTALPSERCFSIVLLVFPWLAFPPFSLLGPWGPASSLDLFHASGDGGSMRTRNCQEPGGPRGGSAWPSFLRRQPATGFGRAAEEQLNQLQDFCSCVCSSFEFWLVIWLPLGVSATAQFPATTRHSCKIQLTQPEAMSVVAAHDRFGFLQNHGAWEQEACQQSGHRCHSWPSDSRQ